MLRGFASLSRSFATAAAAVPKAAYLSSAEVQGRVVAVLASLPQVDPEVVSGTSHLFQDLRLDSLQREHAFEQLRREFCVEVPASLLSVNQIVDHISKHPKAK